MLYVTSFSVYLGKELVKTFKWIQGKGRVFFSIIFVIAKMHLFINEKKHSWHNASIQIYSGFSWYTLILPSKETEGTRLI